MVEFYSGDPDSSVAVQAMGLDAVPSTLGEALGAEVASGFAGSLGPRIARSMYRSGVDPSLVDGSANIGFVPEPETPAPLLSPEAANAKYGIKGVLSFDQPVTDLAAADLYDAKHAEVMRQDIMERAPSSFAVRTAASFAGSLMDPTNLALALIPGVGEAPVANALGGGLLARMAGRAVQGATAGAAGMAAMEPLNALLDSQEHTDWTMADALRNVAFGGLLGGGLHVLGGALGDRMSAREAVREGRGAEREPVTSAASDTADVATTSDTAADPNQTETANAAPVVTEVPDAAISLPTEPGAEASEQMSAISLPVRLEDAGPDARETLLRGALGSVIDDRPVIVASALDAIEAERQALGAAYDTVRANPAGPADDPLVRISPTDIDNVIVSRGGFKGMGDATVQGSGYGLVKFIWRHGEESGKPIGEQITRGDITSFPDVIRSYDPSREAGNGQGREWRVSLPGPDGQPRTVVYAENTITGKADPRLVTVHVETLDPKGPMSAPRPSGGFGALPEDTAAGLSISDAGAGDGDVGSSTAGSKPVDVAQSLDDLRAAVLAPDAERASISAAADRAASQSPPQLVDLQAQIAELERQARLPPPVPADSTRFYRGEESQEGRLIRMPSPDPDQNPGRYFSTDRDQAQHFGRLKYVDVANSDPLAAKITEDPDLPGTSARLLPRELADKARWEDGGVDFGQTTPATSGDAAIDAAQVGVEQAEQRASAIQQAATCLARGGL